MAIEITKKYNIKKVISFWSNKYSIKVMAKMTFFFSYSPLTAIICKGFRNHNNVYSTRYYLTIGDENRSNITKM
jgi:phosphate starvation-inducible membrane PsiE